ncbi:hypothetical protein [Haloplanus sp. C73]|uniref:hypothetical protein n=1 Tax=Haloplanus sp. C73 TaxID=3421641 RepID=UPI003EC0D943
MTDDRAPADTFGVSIGVDDDAMRFLVHVPSALDGDWRDRDAFQEMVERAVWERLDRDPTLRAVARVASTGERVDLGTVTLRPDGTVVEETLERPKP